MEIGDLWQPLLLSLQIAGAATALAALVGVPLALFMSRHRFKGKSLLDALIIVPMVMPPTVVGYVILVLLGQDGWVGHWLYRAFNYSIIFRFEGAVLAAAVVAMPLLYLPAKAGFLGVERDLEGLRPADGRDQWQVFWHVSLPVARRAIYSGLLLAFARALGEFGATVMVFGLGSGRLTLPISIYVNWLNGELPHAMAAVLALGAISLALTMVHNRSSASFQE